MNSWKTTASYRSLWNEDKRINFKVILNFKYNKKEADYIYIYIYSWLYIYRYTVVLN